MPALGGSSSELGAHLPLHTEACVLMARAWGGGEERYLQPDLRSGFGAKNRPGETQGWVPLDWKPTSLLPGRRQKDPGQAFSEAGLGNSSCRPPLPYPSEGDRRAGRRIREQRLPTGFARPPRQGPNPFTALQLLTREERRGGSQGPCRPGRCMCQERGSCHHILRSPAQLPVRP